MMRVQMKVCRQTDVSDRKGAPFMYCAAQQCFKISDAMIPHFA